MSAARTEIIGLQYLRGIAALMVVVDHAALTVATPKYFGAGLWNSVLIRGASGVDLFFLISGFIITWVSLTPEGAPRQSPAQFFGRRFVRIVPLLWLAVISYAALRLLGRGLFDFGASLRALVLWPVGTLEPLNIWTLRYEAIFYVVFAATMMGPKILRPLLVVWAVAPIILALAGGTNSPWLRAIAYPVNVEFGAGVLIALLTQRFGRKSIKSPIDPALLLTAAGVGLMFFAEAADLRFHLVEKTLLAAAFCAPIIWFGVNVSCPMGIPQRGLLLLGNASYAIYLFHPHILSAAAGVWSKLAPGTPVWLLTPGMVIVALAGGAAIHFAVEKPMLNLMRSWRSRAAVAASG